eukprot:tig00001038_g6513.t1
MKGRLVLLALSALVVLAAASNVKDLTPDNFDANVDGSRGAFVEFFAPWCGHCKALAPEYEVVGDAFAKVPEVLVAKVDADQHKELASRFNIQGFPTLKWFPKGSTEPEEYNGGRSADDIINFINQKAGTRAKVKAATSFVPALTPADFDSVVLDKTKDVMVEFYAPWCGHCKRLAPDYEKVAETYKDESSVVVAKVDADAHRSLAERFDVKGYPTLVWFPKDNKEGVKYEGGRDPEAFVEFINKNAGTHRVLGGGLSADAGRIEELDTLAKDYVKEAADSRAKLREQATKLAAGQGDKQSSADYYLKVMKSIDEKGDAYPKTEKARLEKMLNGKALNGVKATEFQKKVNVLSAFLPDEE